MRVRRIAMLAAVAVSALAVLTGCTDDPPEGRVLGGEEEQSSGTAETTSTPTPTPTTTSSPGRVVTDGPGEVEGSEEEQVKAFMRTYIREQNKATGNGDFSTVNTMIEKCSVCEESQRYITGAYQSGGKVEGGRYTDPQITVDGKDEQTGDVFVTVKSVISAYKTTDGSGKVIDQGPAEELTYQYTVRKIDGKWQLVGGRVVG